MEMEEYLKILKATKPSLKETGSLDIHVSSTGGGIVKTIYSEETCPRCKHQVFKKVIVTFNKPVQLTVFTAGLLYMLYCLKQKPHDYASYHKCPAGKEFIENIVKTEVYDV